MEVIQESRQAPWSLDFPFGLPFEVMEPGALWPAQLDLLPNWGEDAYGVGLECLRRAKALGGPNHIRRLTDSEEKAPFNPYHYRIIYQNFYSMRDVLGPLRCRRRTFFAAVLQLKQLLPGNRMTKLPLYEYQDLPCRASLARLSGLNRTSTCFSNTMLANDRRRRLRMRTLMIRAQELIDR